MPGRFLLTLSLALLVGGCATAPKRTLSPDQVASLRLSAIKVQVAPDATLWWGEGERRYAAAQGRSRMEAAAIGKTPEGRAHLSGVIAAKTKDALQQRIGGRLHGGRDVVLQVTVRGVFIASAAQRILVGGGHFLKADAELVDAKTGAVVLSYTSQNAKAYAGQGIGVLVDQAFADPIDRVVDSYATTYAKWLSRA